jgi:hypothetical protein
MNRGVRAAVVGVVLVGLVLSACGGADPEPTVGANTNPSHSSTSVSAPADQRSPGRLVPAWAPHHLSPDGRTLTIGVPQPCGAVWEDLDVTMDESTEEVIIDAAVTEISATGCEAASTIQFVDLELARPLGDRRIVDRADPARELLWTVAPGSVQARVILEPAPGAVIADVPDDLYLVIGADVPMIPLSIDQVRSGLVLPMPITYEPGVQKVGIYGSIDQLPLDPERFVAQGSLPIPGPDPALAFQDLVITLAPGAVGADGRMLVVDPDKVELTWRPTPDR